MAPTLTLQSLRKKLKKHLISWGTAPIVNGVAAVFSVLAGALASFFTGSIRASLGLPVNGNGAGFSTDHFQISGEALTFWSLVLFAALLFAWSKYADSAVDNEHKVFVGNALQGLESMPPSAFLLRLAEEYVESHAELSKLRALNRPNMKSLTIANVDRSIQTVLTSLAHIIEAYDGHLNRTYRISLLLFIRKSWNEEKLSKIVNIATLNQSAQQGLLESFSTLSIIYPQLSTLEPLSAENEFAYPIHRPHGEGDDRNVLPGPPRAFHLQKMFECHAVDSDLSQLTNFFADTNHTLAMKDFYKNGPGKNVKSFVSIPVPSNKWDMTLDTTNSAMSGVIHIEASEINVMKSASGFFWPVAQPYLLIISDMLAIRSALGTTPPVQI